MPTVVSFLLLFFSSFAFFSCSDRLNFCFLLRSTSHRKLSHPYSSHFFELHRFFMFVVRHRFGLRPSHRHHYHHHDRLNFCFPLRSMSLRKPSFPYSKSWKGQDKPSSKKETISSFLLFFPSLFFPSFHPHHHFPSHYYSDRLNLCFPLRSMSLRKLSHPCSKNWREQDKLSSKKETLAKLKRSNGNKNSPRLKRRLIPW